MKAKTAILAPTAPVALIAQLLFWGASLVLGFALILMPTVHSFSLGLLQALTALFTVGAVHSGGPANTGVDIAVGAIWVVIVALQIAYLPALYGAFSRREGLVSLLESRAGTPAWGPELLARHQLVGITDTLPDLYASWEEWSADVAESHTTYPILLLFRSPEPWFSLGARRACRARWGGNASGARPEYCFVGGSALPPHGLYASAANRPLAGVERRSRPEPRRPDSAQLEEFRERRRDAGEGGISYRAQHGRGVARLPRLAGQL